MISEVLKVLITKMEYTINAINEIELAIQEKGIDTTNHTLYDYAADIRLIGDETGSSQLIPNGEKVLTTSKISKPISYIKTDDNLTPYDGIRNVLYEEEISDEVTKTTMILMNQFIVTTGNKVSIGIVRELEESEMNE